MTKIMRSHGLQTVYGTFIFSPMILIYESDTFYQLAARSFTFVNASSTEYEHTRKLRLTSPWGMSRTAVTELVTREVRRLETTIRKVELLEFVARYLWTHRGELGAAIILKKTVQEMQSWLRKPQIYRKLQPPSAGRHCWRSVKQDWCAVKGDKPSNVLFIYLFALHSAPWLIINQHGRDENKAMMTKNEKKQTLNPSTTRASVLW